MDPMADQIPVVQGEWAVQADCLIAVARCHHCGVAFGLAGEIDHLRSGDAMHRCRVCQRISRVAAQGKPPEIEPRWSQYQAECAAALEEATDAQ